MDDVCRLDLVLVAVNQYVGEDPTEISKIIVYVKVKTFMVIFKTQ